MEMNTYSASEKPSPDERERLVRSFETWLENALADEAPPSGLTAELLGALQTGDPLPSVDGDCDLYSLWSAMTALTQEVRLQGRTFAQLKDTLSRNLEASGERLRCTQAQRREIDTLLDLRDRVERGRSAAQNAVEELSTSRLPRWARWLGVAGRRAQHAQEILTAISQGHRLTLDRLDQALLDLHVNAIVCEGQKFDPQRMTAIAIEATEAVPEGTVVEVYRNGYDWESEVYRPAQVKVARPPEGN
jgi:molecular chaperone GrpE (heat shock protein)